MKAKWGLGFTKIHNREMRIIIDEGIGIVLEHLGANPIDFEVERILRMGACGTRGYPTSPEDVYRRMGATKQKLDSDLKQHKMPPIRKLIAWGNLIPAIGELGFRSGDSATSSMEKLSIHWGYGSGGSISAKCNNHCDRYPTELTDGSREFAERAVLRWKDKTTQ